MTLKFANPLLAEADRILALLRDGAWRTSRELGMDLSSTRYLTRNNYVTTRLMGPGHGNLNVYKITPVGAALADVFAGLRGRTQGETNVPRDQAHDHAHRLTPQ